MVTIEQLAVFPTLKIHQLRIEPKRVKASYTIVSSDGSLAENELIYSYDDPFFDIKIATDVNLASMMVAQVGLNYGLFFNEIIFDGLFDQADKRFLTDMMENTSREIWVNKFCFPNVFLKPPFDEVQVEKKAKYTNAELVFINSDFGDLTLTKQEATPDYNEFAILSSGGKDSLLTYGLVKEIGGAHPIFINESGRHWFTAVNAHRHFKEIEPNTRKPWCNSDRIFNWMAKQMPFIKENFQDIRADMYPIRLWTVAVFLFGALPVARKKNIGNILIGNEYDTTVRGNHQGISHYNALYDQSRYFDLTLTKYYERKGWNLRQYSILRSLSELLILKILVKRYPDLQRLQVSCHAAHEEDGKMFPCGNCEKCRRIIGMLKALDEDPKRCGYTDAQIEKGLQALSVKSVKQLGSDAAHLYHLLLSKGLIPNNEHTNRLAKSHPEILQLRFDNERSLPSDIPEEFQKSLIKIYSKYSDGTVEMHDHKWVKR
jgi:hypothetical protein